MSDSKPLVADKSASSEGKRSLWPAGIGALGVVFGDIGTSPLYALRQSFYGVNAVAVTPQNVLGILSLVFWTLIIIISFKYLLFVMRQNNDGEGGIIALVALCRSLSRGHRFFALLLIPLGLFGAALLYGDATITPAISVLSAIEGLSAVNPSFELWVIPLTVTILLLLFIAQHKGSSRLGSVFGPIMLIWFVTLALLGVRGILLYPSVFEAINPSYALAFFVHNGMQGFLVLGTVFLVVTGGEAMYAGMGHFGIGPIRLSWFGVVMPALLLNYFGQGALILDQPEAAMHPFFHLAPSALEYPLIALATVATIIASQAVISGTFSLTAQAIQLDMLPRMRVVHTSGEERGQVYIPLVNWLLMLATIGVVLAFKSSDKLGAAYGLSVSADMAITTVLATAIAMRSGAKPWLAAATGLALWVVDWAFLSANLVKFFDGGWYPVLAGLMIFTIMTTWRRGREMITRQLKCGSHTLTEFIADITRDKVHRIPGTAVFLTAHTDEPPPLLLHHLDHHHVLQRQLILLNVRTREVPRVPAAQRFAIKSLSEGCFIVRLDYGYMQSPNIPAALRLSEHEGLVIDLKEVTYYLGLETVIPMDDHKGMWLWREHLFAFLERNSLRASAFFNIPAHQVVELGAQIEL